MAAGRFRDPRGTRQYTARRMRAFLAALLLVAAAARADNSIKDPGAPWPTFVDLPRATAMGGAHAAIATGNDAITVNPAGISQQRRYHIEVDGLLDSRFPAQALMASIVDTTSSPVGTGLLFSRWGSGQPDGRGEGWYGALAYSYGIGGNYFIGGETKYYRFNTPDGPVRQFAQDVGLLARRGNFAYGAVIQNVSTSAVPMFPVTSTIGIAWGNDRDWHVAFDYKADLSDLNNVKHRGAGGLELLVGDSIALRGGATWDATHDLWWLSAGVGLLTEKGGAQIVLRRRLNGDGFDQFLEAGITLYLE
jgi:hypothetical protein